VVFLSITERDSCRELSVPIWRAKASVGLFVARKEKAVLRKLIFDEDEEEEKQQSTTTTTTTTTATRKDKEEVSPDDTVGAPLEDDEDE